MGKGGKEREVGGGEEVPQLNRRPLNLTIHISSKKSDKNGKEEVRTRGTGTAIKCKFMIPVSIRLSWIDNNLTEFRSDSSKIRIFNFEFK